MTAKRKFQIATDMLMIVMLPFLMAYQLIGEAIHEWIGMGMFLLFLCHHLLNRNWHKNLLKGKYNKYRLLLTGMDLILFIIMVSLAISGTLLSRHIFTFLQPEGGISGARIIHLLSSYWGFVLMSIHLGLHWNVIAAAINRTTRPKSSAGKKRVIFRIAVGAVCLYGIYAFMERDIGTYMFLKSEYVFFDFNSPLLKFFIDYIAIMLLFASIGNYLGIFCRKRRNAHEGVSNQQQRQKGREHRHFN